MAKWVSALYGREWANGRSAKALLKPFSINSLFNTGDRNTKRINEAWSAYTGLAEPPAISKNADTDNVSLDENGRLALLVHTLGEIEDEGTQAALLRGMLRGLEGRRNVTAPDGWTKLGDRFANSNNATVRELSMQLSQVFGDRAATERALALVDDRSVDINIRRSALRSLLNQQNQDASNALQALLDEPALTLDAIRGYAIVENAIAPSLLLQRYEKLDPEHRRAVIETLATRKPYGTGST